MKNCTNNVLIPNITQQNFSIFLVICEFKISHYVPKYPFYRYPCRTHCPIVSNHLWSEDTISERTLEVDSQWISRIPINTHWFSCTYSFSRTAFQLYYHHFIAFPSFKENLSFPGACPQTLSTRSRHPTQK